MVSQKYSKSMPLCVVLLSVLTILCTKPAVGVATEVSSQVRSDFSLAKFTPQKTQKRSRNRRVLSRVTKCLKSMYPKRLFSATKEKALYSVVYPILAKYYEIREDGLQRADYFNIFRKLCYLYLAKKWYNEWTCSSTLLYSATGVVVKCAVDWIETRTDSSHSHKDLHQQNYVNRMLAFLNEDQKQYIANDKELFGSVSVAQEFNDPRLLKENQAFHSLLNIEQVEYLDTIIFEYMSHHNVLRSYLTRKKEVANQGELRTNGLKKRYNAAQSPLPWADAIDVQINYDQLETLAAETTDADLS